MTTARDRHVGTFTWNELGTRDLAASKAFYAGLFGWALRDEDMGELGTYTLVLQGERDVGGMYELSGERFEGIPAHWMGYVGVADADAAAARAVELGGTVRMPAMDVHGVGRMAVLADNEGASFAVFQDTQGEGESHDPPRDRHGSFCWNELAAREAGATEAFYTGLFGWTAETTDVPHRYTTFSRDGQRVAGMVHMNAQWGDLPAHWMTYVRVDDCDAAAARITELGGKVCVPPTDIGPAGRFSVANAPDGAVFSIITPPAG